MYNKWIHLNSLTANMTKLNACDSADVALDIKFDRVCPDQLQVQVGGQVSHDMKAGDNPEKF